MFDTITITGRFNNLGRFVFVADPAADTISLTFLDHKRTAAIPCNGDPFHEQVSNILFDFIASDVDESFTVQEGESVAEAIDQMVKNLEKCTS